MIGVWAGCVGAAWAGAAGLSVGAGSIGAWGLSGPHVGAWGSFDPPDSPALGWSVGGDVSVQGRDDGFGAPRVGLQGGATLDLAWRVEDTTIRLGLGPFAEVDVPSSEDLKSPVFRLDGVLAPRARGAVEWRWRRLVARGNASVHLTRGLTLGPQNLGWEVGVGVGAAWGPRD